jgi:hypothetical protein
MVGKEAEEDQGEDQRRDRLTKMEGEVSVVKRRAL